MPALQATKPRARTAPPVIPAGIVAVPRTTQADPKRRPPDAEVIDYLRHLVAHPTHSLVTIAATPAIATYLKTLAPKHAGIIPERTRSLERDITEGRWVENGQPFIIAEGVMIDGLQRAQAIIQAGKAAIIDIRFGISRQAVATIDTGAERGVIRTFMREGIPYATHTAGILRVLYLNRHMAEGETWARRLYSPAEALRDYTQDPVALEQAGRMALTAGKHIPAFARTPIAAALYVAIRETDPLEVGAFLEVVLHKARLGKTSPAMRMREWSEGLQPRVTMAQRLQHFAIALRTWQAFRDDERLAAPLKWRLGTPVPVESRAIT